MAFRFRKSARLGPLRFHFSTNGLSSISVGGRGASFNIPVNRSGGNRSTVGLPGTGLSWSVEHEAGVAEGLPNSRRLKPGKLDLLKQQCLQILHQELFAPGNDAHRLWSEGLISRRAGGSMAESVISNTAGGRRETPAVFAV